MDRGAARRFEAVLAAYLAGRGWRQTRCTSCGRAYFGKSSTACGSPWCPGTRRVPVPSQEPCRFRPLGQIWDRLAGTLRARGLPVVPPADLRTAGAGTDLIVSALQHLDPVVSGGADPPAGPYVLAQPCVRWQYLPEAGREPGISSAFVNLSSLEVGLTDLAGRIPVHLDGWLDAFSAAGIFAARLTIALTDEDCAYGPYRGRRADINCAGVELGEINWYYQVDDAGHRGLTVVDFGFCLERIAWVANPGDTYHALLAPAPLALQPEGGVSNDRARTLALLTAYGIRPGSRGPRRYARLLADELAGHYLCGRDIAGLLYDAAGYWARFDVPARVPDGPTGTRTVGDLALDAVRHQAQRRLADTLGLTDEPPAASFADALDRLSTRAGGRNRVLAALEGVCPDRR